MMLHRRSTRLHDLQFVFHCSNLPFSCRATSDRETKTLVPPIKYRESSNSADNLGCDFRPCGFFTNSHKLLL